MTTRTTLAHLLADPGSSAPAIVSTDPAVAEAAVFGVPDPKYGEEVAAAVVPHDNCDAIKLQEFCRERLADFKVPKFIQITSALPKNVMGKIKRRDVAVAIQRVQSPGGGRMTSNPQTREYPAQWDFMILVLAVAGGSVDGVLILAFSVLTGAQTGNTVLLGVALAQGRLATALGSMVSFVGYLIGAALGEFILVRHDDTWPWTSAVGTVLIAELIPLGCLFIFWRLAGPHPAQQTIYMLVIYAASAMGLQSAVMLHLHGGPTTTYLTGTLTAFATKLIRWLRQVETASVSAHARQQSILMTAFSTVDGPWIYGLTWLVYLTGTVAGSLLYLYTGETAVLLPIVAIVVVIAAAHHHLKESIKQTDSGGYGHGNAGF